MSLRVLEGQGGDVDSCLTFSTAENQILLVKIPKVKSPTLSQIPRQGWGTLLLFIFFYCAKPSACVTAPLATA